MAEGEKEGGGWGWTAAIMTAVGAVLAFLGFTAWKQVSAEASVSWETCRRESPLSVTRVARGSSL